MTAETTHEQHPDDNPKINSALNELTPRIDELLTQAATDGKAQFVLLANADGVTHMRGQTFPGQEIALLQEALIVRLRQAEVGLPVSLEETLETFRAYVSQRLMDFRDMPNRWGTPQATEMQALALVEAELVVTAPLFRGGPSLLLENYLKLLKGKYPQLEGRALHELVGNGLEEKDFWFELFIIVAAARETCLISAVRPVVVRGFGEADISLGLPEGETVDLSSYKEISLSDLAHLTHGISPEEPTEQSPR